MRFALKSLVLLLMYFIARPTMADPPAHTLMGQDGVVEALDEIGAVPLHHEAGSAFVGERFYAGGRDGAIHAITVTDRYLDWCKVQLAVDPPVALQRFAAYSRPATFIPLERHPTARAEVARKSEAQIRAQGGSGSIEPAEIWRFRPSPSVPAFVLATLHSGNYLSRETIDNPGTFDAITLFREDADGLTLLDQIVWLLDPTYGVQMEATAVAAAINPFTQRMDLFVYVSSFEYGGDFVYDITDGKFAKRAETECSM